MEIGTLVVGPAFVTGRSSRTRVAALIAAILLVLATIVLVQQTHASPAGAAPASASVNGNAAQINISSIVCPILVAVRNAFAGTPFGGFVTPILNSLIVSFGCAPSP